MTTLAERLTQAMLGPPKVSQAKLARECGVKPPSVSDWLSGRTKALEGSNLLNAARTLGVRPEWLATGVPPMRSANVVALPSQPAGFSRERMEKAVEVARYWMDLEGLRGGVEDHIPLLHKAVVLTFAAEESATVMDLSKRLAAQLREEKASGDQRRDPVEPGPGSGEVRAAGARKRTKPANHRT